MHSLLACLPPSLPSSLPALLPLDGLRETSRSNPAHMLLQASKATSVGGKEGGREGEREG